MKKDNHNTGRQETYSMPDIDIIDLENDGNENTNSENTSSGINGFEPIEEEHNTAVRRPTAAHSKPISEKKGFKRLLNHHTVFLLLFVGIIAVIVVRCKNWGEEVNLDEIFKEGADITYSDTLDEVLPLIDGEGHILDSSLKDPVIVAFGNAPFADDRDSEDNLANIIAETTGATVYNCSVSGSYLAAQSYAYDSDLAPMDAYCFYWLATLATQGSIVPYYESAAEALGEDVPPEAGEVIDTLTSLDFNEVDVITIMYDATDYLMGHLMYSDQNSTDTLQFTGNLEAGIELFQNAYPHIRIIVMSPTYAFAVDTKGNYVSSDMYTYGQDVLSTYSIKEYQSCSARSVSFIDHLYGTITEDNAKDYLIDNLHLNTEGRRLVADRFAHFLYYYNK